MTLEKWVERLTKHFAVPVEFDDAGNPTMVQCKLDSETRNAIAAAIREAEAEMKERCACAAEAAMCEQGTDDPHTALEWAARDIRALE